MFDPDICLCMGEGCNLKDTCLRYQYHLRASMEKEENYNTYFVDPPVENGNCEYKIECCV